ncbi:MAG: carboxymuconolactone decarboxylase family protein [Thermoanaerobaculia bacterium]|nr:carboxymuconolactone decarboxylase family protein [Thermoanaerobaculia bacterium]
MRLTEPRIAPLGDADWPEEARELRERFIDGEGPGAGKVLNIFATLGHHPQLLKRWLVFGNHVLMKSTLPPRDREILILRIGWLCRAEYEWGQHVVIGRRAGLSDEDIARIAEGPDADGWDPFEATLVRAADELHADAMLSDATWNALAERYDTRQMLDVVFTVGQYNLVSMVLNSTGVQLDEGIDGFPAK